MQLYTIGHSNRSAEDFLALLQAHGIKQLADVRAMPRSRFNPHFNEKPLAAMLAQHGIGYWWMPELGGKRAARPDSENTGLRGGGFQGYADYMATDAFMHGLHALLTHAHQGRTAFMCAEREPSQCHRGFIADALLAQGHAVLHIVRAGESTPHRLHEAAVRNGDGTLTYPGAQPRQMPLL